MNVQAASAAYYDSGRSGDSWEDAYIISSAEDLVTLKNRVNSGEELLGKYYVLEANIDLTSEASWEGIGASYFFIGHFDGQGHTIKMESRNSFCIGLFHSISSGNGNIAVRNLTITGTIGNDTQERQVLYAGAIAWRMYSGIIEHCSFYGKIILLNSSSSYGAGGIVAHLINGTVRNCRVSAEISTNVVAGHIVGGIAGLVSQGGNIENCIVEENTRITARFVGGIAGYVFSDFSGNISGNRWPRIYPQFGNDYTPQPQEDPTPQENTSTDWNGHRYQLFNESLTWEQARSRCEALGGHLATITSQAEQNAITSLLTSSQTDYYGYWLGGYTDNFGWRHWVTDEPFEKQYQNFAEGQPDGSGGYLMILESGRWDDVQPDENTAGFICEWDNELEQVKAAPVAQSFAEWLANPELRADSDGAAPSPVDRSHLNSNPPRIAASSVFAATDEDLPVSYDARKAIGLPEARDQGKFGTCWAFAAIGAMEASYRKQEMTSLGEDPDLSELHLAWFTYKAIFSKDIAPNESTVEYGGTPDKAETYFSTLKTAPVKEADMPYSAASRNDSEIESFLAGKTFTRAPVTLKTTHVLGKMSADISSVKAEIMKYGAVYFHYHTDDRGYNNFHNSFYYPPALGLHAALLVGWDDNFPKENF